MQPSDLLNKKIGVLIKTTAVDFPSFLATSIFLTGCNLRCPYCYNKALVTNTLSETEGVTFSEVIQHLEKRKNVLKGFVISGGEALLSPYLEPLIREAKKLGYKIKIDTNGTLPHLLEKLIQNSELCPDFIAMDFKTSFENYGKLLPLSDETQTQKIVEAIKKSISILSDFPRDKREFRTVLVPSLVAKADIEKMAKALPKDASWQFANFRNENCLDPAYNQISPYIEKDALSLVEYAKEFISGANLR